MGETQKDPSSTIVMQSNDATLSYTWFYGQGAQM